MNIGEDVAKVIRNISLVKDEDMVWILTHVHEEIVKRWPEAEFNLGEKLDNKMLSGWRCGHCSFFYFNWNYDEIPTDCNDWFWEESRRLTHGEK